MSLSKILNFPKEILQTIFNFIGLRFLEAIQEIPQIRPYVLRALYSKVIINYYRQADQYRLFEKPQFTIGAHLRQPDYEDPDILSLSELQKIIYDNDLPPPQEIYFNDPMDLMHAHAYLPNLLKNSEIVISFDYYDLESNIDPRIVKTLKSYPYNVTKLESYYYMNQSKYGSNEKWFNNAKALDLKNIYSLKKVFNQANFDNLVDLSLQIIVRQGFDAKDFELIPSSVKKLNCEFEDAEPEDVISLRFPIGLTDLRFGIYPSEDSDYEDSDSEETEDSYVIDLRYLENLKKLNYFFTAGSIICPKNLLELNASSSVSFRELCRDCPDLKKLYCNVFSDITGDFPKKVTDFTIGVRGLIALYEYWKDSGNMRNGPKRQKLDDTAHFLSKILPQLHNFKVAGFFRGSPEFTLFPKESAAYDFSNLKKLSTILPYDLKIGDIPSSLTSLRINEMKSLNFSRFKYFDNLVDVSFNELNDISTFKCEFGPSLKYLEIGNSTIKAIDLISPNLDYLVVTNTSISTINQSTFQVPQSIIELDISENGITNIDDSFTFPDNLRALDISNNSLTKLGNLPENLKKLRCGRNKFDPDQYHYSFPSSLEVFEMTNMSMYKGGKSTRFFDFSNCKSLKHLDMSSVSYHSAKLSLDVFPKSLVYLNLSGMEFGEIEGQFTDFKELKTLGLELMVLFYYLEETDAKIDDGEEEHYFGPKMRHLLNFNSKIPDGLYERVEEDLRRRE
ncbi:hypothetical protein G210_1551 [Candida maltosa Xu316]|uniref:Uncharacterized protein n=1 Tax=Candida maltosa (strain Xu316) TaxID=1245528 RepID=M3J7A6_CANMX|nr:hypothetical protein G210_1551 [Candida maltosa Xu316]